MAYQIAKSEWIWHDGEFIPWDEAQIHVLSHAVQFGSSVFEGIRCYSTPQGPAVFRLQEHLQRFFNTCKIYRTELAYGMDDLVSAVCALVERNQLDACYVRPMVVRTVGAAGMVPFASPPEVFIPCWPWGAYLGDEALEKGVDVCVATWQRMAPNTFPAMAKIAGNYLNGQLVKMEALANGYAEGIALGPDGMISEGSGQNVFVVRDGVIYTPPIDGTLLPGITRDSLITIARDEGFTVNERPLPREVLYIADEVFFTGTAAEVTPVRSVDKIQVGHGGPGEITRRLQTRFLQTVRGETPDTHGWLTHVRSHGTREQARKAGRVSTEAALDVS